MKWFKTADFDCKETGENLMDRHFLSALDALREQCGFPFTITSGFRSRFHSKEKDKLVGGTHTEGIASDIRISNGGERYRIVNEAVRMGFTGIGVANTFVHVDMREGPAVMWVY